MEKFKLVHTVVFVDISLVFTLSSIPNVFVHNTFFKIMISCNLEILDQQD